MDTSRQIEQHAAAWLTQRDMGEWSEHHDARLQQWLDASTEHYIAFIRLEHVWEQARRLKALDASGSGDLPPAGEWRLSPFVDQSQPRQRSVWRRHARTFTLAASMLLVAGAAAWVTSGVVRGERYSTPVGGVSLLPMADGSKITLNTDSQIRVVLSDVERRVQLARGEAFFDVAKDPHRPFVVMAGDQRVTVLGTKFSVRREGNDLRVMVTEGLVQWEDMPLPTGSVATKVLGRTQVEQESTQQLEDYLSWRNGYLVFHDTALAEAVAEFNRYNTRQLVIRDPAVAAIRFSGKLRPTNVEAFVRVLETGFDIEARAHARDVLLSARK